MESLKNHERRLNMFNWDCTEKRMMPNIIISSKQVSTLKFELIMSYKSEFENMGNGSPH